MLASVDTERDQAIMRATIRGYVERWRAGVELQHQRLQVSDSETKDELDAFFFAVALKNLRENVRWASDYCNGERDGERGRPLRAALDAFDRAVPGAAYVRDLQQHARDYETGASDRHLKHVKPPLAICWENNVVRRSEPEGRATGDGPPLGRLHSDRVRTPARCRPR